MHLLAVSGMAHGNMSSRTETDFGSVSVFTLAVVAEDERHHSEQMTHERGSGQRSGQLDLGTKPAKAAAQCSSHSFHKTSCHNNCVLTTSTQGPAPVNLGLIVTAFIYDLN